LDPRSVRPDFDVNIGEVCEIYSPHTLPNPGITAIAEVEITTPFLPLDVFARDTTQLTAP
jgi:hypothetical protein